LIAGIGIAPEPLRRLGKPFEQIERRLTQDLSRLAPWPCGREIAG
jgi:hypothetical protein